MAKYRAEEAENLTEQEDAAPAGAYPAVMEITRRLEVELGMSGTAIEVVDAACKELNISTEGLSLVERAHRRTTSSTARRRKPPPTSSTSR